MKAIKFAIIGLLICLPFQLSTLAQIPTNINYIGKRYIDYSFDYGKSWTRLSIYPNTDKNRIKYDGLHRKFISDDYGKHWQLVQQDTNIKHNNNSVVISPNPTLTKQISLSFVSQNTGNVSVKIYNVQYHLLLERSFQIADGENRLNIDLTNEFSTGHYFVQIEVNEQLFINNFIVK